MTNFCIHQKHWTGTYYDPPETWCELEYDDICGENCPYRFSKEDYDDERREDWDDDYAEYKEELYRDFFDL